MNSITQSILAEQAAETAKSLQLAATEALQRCVVNDSQTRCTALIREFNESPITLKFYTPIGGNTNSGVPRLTIYATIRSSALYNSLGQFIKLGMRIYLVWLDGDLIATFNAERAHSRYVRSVYGLVGEEYTTAERLASKSDRLLTLEETKEAVRNRKSGSAEDPDCAVVGRVLNSGMYSTNVNYSDLKTGLFSLPSDFIHDVVQHMSKFLAINAPSEVKPETSSAVKV
jgi:hypothetical protein